MFPQKRAAGAAGAAAEELPGSFLIGSIAGSLGNLLGSFGGSTLSLGELLGRQDSFEAPSKRVPAGAGAGAGAGGGA